MAYCFSQFKLNLQVKIECLGDSLLKIKDLVFFFYFTEVVVLGDQFYSFSLASAPFREIIYWNIRNLWFRLTKNNIEMNPWGLVGIHVTWDRGGKADTCY